jgi:hypothetical protein
MSTLTLLSAAEPASPLVLVVRKAQAAKLIQELVQKGRDIKALRIRSLERLDTARQEKAAWVQDVMTVLLSVFSDSSAADHFNDWAPEVLPEYAPVDAFVEAFYAEVNHRIQRLKAILKYAADLPEPVMAAAPATEEPAPPVEPAPAQALSSEAAPVVSVPAKAAAPNVEPAEATAPVAAAQASGASRPATPTPARGKTVASAGAAAAQAAPPQPRPIVRPSRRLLLLQVQGSASAPANASVAKAMAAFAAHLGLEAVAVEVGANDVRSVCERLDQQRDAAFAVISSAPPDGSAAASGAGADAQFTLVLGFAIGRFGMRRVLLLGSAPLPGALNLCCIPFDAAGGWQLQLARQMKRAGIEIDLNRLC